MTNNQQKYVCSECAGDNELKPDIFAEEKIRKTCSYCRNRRNCISVDSLANVVDEIYREDYKLCDDGNGDPPSEIIERILQLDTSAGYLDNDLVDILSSEESLSSWHKDIEPMYDESMTYCYKYPPINDGREHKELWDIFCDRIKHRTRFFNNQLIDWLNDIFLGLDTFNYDEDISPIRTIQPNDSDAVFYRARRTQSVQERIKICCHPSQELSSPPSHLASGGRMNPTGISVFYAAFERETCISEIRLPVGEIAISGQFKLEKPIAIFDLSIFDKINPENTTSNGYTSRIVGDEFLDKFEDRLEFLKTFSEEISKPIPPHKETLDYMPTQALVEYLAYHYEPKIDAVVYASTQTNGRGKNIVFLNHAANVKKEQQPDGGKYRAIWGTGYYNVLPHKDGSSRFSSYSPENWEEYADVNFEDDWAYDGNSSLSFVEGSLNLHKVKAINYDLECFDVTVNQNQADEPYSGLDIEQDF
ncbi:MAG: RES domain-containing protein [Methylovulum miyakonense]|uniref:RES domain-containing protein n=1 Tax=Methylovulum miyakonense TaxID=645578 RepID=UPI003BB75B6C